MQEPSTQKLLKSAAAQHQGGQLRQAEELYRRVLAQDPDNADALHGVGLLAMRSSRPDLAAAYIARAAMLAPGVAVYQYNLGEAWLVTGDLVQAAACLRHAVRLEPNRPEPHAALGVALSHTGKFDEAAVCIDRAIRLGLDRPELHQHLANALLQINQFAEAETHARKATEGAPNLAESWQSLGEAVGNQGRAEEAAGHFRKAISLKPDFALAHHALGVALTNLGRIDEAVTAFRNAVTVRPDMADSLAHLGSLLVQREKIDEGIETLRKSLKVRPDHIDTHIELARALELAQRPREAADAFEQVLRLSPDNPNVKFHIAALRGEAGPAAPPPALVTALFDRHAETFDQHLTGQLGYRVPQLLLDAVAPLLPPGAAMDVLDLGCGTGLCGPLLRPLAKTLVGIDLSPAMLEKARARNVYDRLEVADVTAALRGAPRGYDLLIAGDVLCYIGDLSEVFSAAATALRPGGRFAFSVELNDGPGWRLRPSRRYAHAYDYVTQTARAGGFEIEQAEQTVLRKESDKDVQGLVVVVRVPAP